MGIIKRAFIFILAVLTLATPAMAVQTLKDEDITVAAPSAVLMEKTTGEVIYEKNAHERLYPASVTKVMTMLLVMEELDAGRLAMEDMVIGSKNAASMGGSQIWLEEGEQMTVHDMLKCVAVVSANDCAVALAEHISGSEEAFVQRMNEKAAALGMADSHFTNCTGLFDDPEHYTSALDIALMSRELALHEGIKEFTTIWMDSVREGKFALSNTNKLIYYYKGATGLKTGFTSAAMYCLAATAERDGMELIAAVMHAPTTDDRWNTAKTLLNYGFANYTLVSLSPDGGLEPVPVELGEAETVLPVAESGTMLLEKASAGEITRTVEYAESVAAPVEKGQELGRLTVKSGNTVIASLPVVAAEDVARLSVWRIFGNLMALVAGG